MDVMYRRIRARVISAVCSPWRREEDVALLFRHFGMPAASCWSGCLGFLSPFAALGGLLFGKIVLLPRQQID